MYFWIQPDELGTALKLFSGLNESRMWNVKQICSEINTRAPKQHLQYNQPHKKVHWIMSWKWSDSSRLHMWETNIRMVFSKPKIQGGDSQGGWAHLTCCDWFGKSQDLTELSRQATDPWTVAESELRSYK